MFLIARDIKRNPNLSHAIWIPLLWLLIISSRMPSEWLSGGATVMTSGAEYVDGSPLDRNIFLALLIAGAVVIMRRSISWQSVTTQNVAVTLFFAYTLVSIVWSDYPVVAFKRWHKVFGHVILVLVVLTDKNPSVAFAALVRRCGYMLLPYSMLYIKYYPELGRGFDAWSGAAVNTGITTNKNALANLCQITGLYFLATFFIKTKEKRFLSGLDLYITLAMLYMTGWLLYMAQSSTATVSTALGACAILGFRLRWIRRHFGLIMITTCLVAGWAFAFTDVKDTFLDELGEDTTLTGRTDLWADLAAVKINPLVGVGFESFWLGDRLEPLWEKYWWHPNQAHNGYFETYLNLGWIGLIIMLAMIVAGYRHARRPTLSTGPPSDMAAALERGLAEFRLAFILSLVPYNFTEATFKATHPSFFMFFLTSINCGPAVLAAAVQNIRAPGWAQTSMAHPSASSTSSSSRRSVVVVPPRKAIRIEAK